MGRLSKLKRELILESNKRLLGESKSYLTEDEKEKIRLPLFKLVTKYSDELKGFIENLNFENYEDEVEFCNNKESRVTDITKKLDDFIDTISKDMKKTPEQVLEALYDKGNSRLIQKIIEIAGPLVKKFSGGKGVILSKEILDGIQKNMSKKYKNVSGGINTMLTGIMSKLNVKVDNICN